MSHLVNRDREYRLLQQRLDDTLLGAPESAGLMKILHLLFSPSEAMLARHVPNHPTAVSVIAKRLGRPVPETNQKLLELAQRGLLLDLECEGVRYYSLPPVVFGFFEFVFMRRRDDVPLKELALLFDEYMVGDGRFVRRVFQGETQPARSLVREDALGAEDHAEILDWERASQLIKSAPAISVGICPCRHKASHLGEACDSPQRACLSFGYAADSMARSGHAERIDALEAMRILEKCNEAGLVQVADNVQRRVAFLCNCCRCCCGMLQAVGNYNIRNAIVSSGWIAEVSTEACSGCGRCVEACPVAAFELRPAPPGTLARNQAVLDESLCLGCGTCRPACKTGAIRMKRRPQRVFCPETIFDKNVTMAIERGMLAELVFSERDRLTHRALGRILKLLEQSSPFKAAMAIKPLRSAFLSAAVAGAKLRMGKLAELLGG
jgi:NAD-dependent dihydropyrimidine dehydrogenase PreA subunit